MSRAQDRSSDRANAFLLAHPVGSLVGFTVTCLILVSGLWGLPDDTFEFGTAPTWLTILSVLFIAYGGVMAILFPVVMKRPPGEVPAVSWAFGMATALVGFAFPVPLGVGRWMPRAGLAVGVVAVSVATWAAVRSADSGAS